MFQILIVLVASFVLFGVVATAGAQLTQPQWRSAPVLGYVYAVATLAAVGWVLFLLTWISPIVGEISAFAVVAAAVVYGIWKRAWRLVVQARAIIGLSFGMLLAYVGFLFLWKNNESNPFLLAGIRFSYRRVGYPLDNLIPYFLANRTAAGQSTQNLFDGWNGSDRPPLQSGLILLGDHVLSPLAFTGYALPFALSLVSQIVWVPVLFALLRTIGLRTRTSILAVVFAGSTATMLINTTYTWPKLLSTALVLGTLTLLIAALRGAIPAGRALTAGAISFTLGALSHGEAAFALPAIAVVAVVLLVRSRRRVVTALIAVGAALVTYLPWFLYQTVFFPPGDILLKWHLAGDENHDSKSFLPTLLHAYSTTPVSTLIHNRVVNFERIFSPDLFSGWAFTESSVGARRFHEYYDSSAVLSLALFVLVAMAIVGIVALVRRRASTPATRRIYRLNLLMLLCVLVWGLVLFRSDGAVVHQGSHVWIVVFLATSYAWLELVNRWLALAVLVAQAVITALFYTQYFGHDQLNWSGLAVAAIGVAVVVGIVVLTVRGRPLPGRDEPRPIRESRI